MALEGLNPLRELGRLSVDVSDLLREPGSSRRLALTEELEGMGLAMGRVQPRLELDLLLESLVEGILVRGRVSGAYRLVCIRCLKEFHQGFRLAVSEVLAYEGAGGEEGYRVQGDRVDLEPMVRDAVLLGMPLHPVCAEGCRGLCVVCGADRNEEECGHAPSGHDPRWEPLARLRSMMEDT
jgi:uncharacterized protein